MKEKQPRILYNKLAIMCCAFTVNTINQEVDHMANSGSRERASKVPVDEEEHTETGKREEDFGTAARKKMEAVAATS